MGLYGTVNMLYLCICVFVFVHFCMRRLVISVLISLDQELSENVWFVWSKTSYSGDVTMRDRRTDERTREDKATQPLDAGRLSFAKITAELRGYAPKNISQHKSALINFNLHSTLNGVKIQKLATLDL